MNNGNGLAGKIALVTGSSSGIGSAIAKRLAELGAVVVLHGRERSNHLSQFQQSMTDSGFTTKTVTADFSVPANLPRFVEDAWQQFGRIDILINNAGGDVLTGKQSQWAFAEKLDYLLKVDVTATLMLSRMFGERMSAAKPSSSIVNIGWDQAYQGMAGDSGEMFATTKGAIMSMTLSLAQSLAPKIRVNCIAPGWIKTDWGKQTSSYWDQRATSESLMGRWGTPVDIAETIAFLTSDQASFISGQIIRVNGGFKYFQENHVE